MTVTDAQGLSSSDTVSVIVHPDPLLMNLVEITFTAGVSVLTEAEVQSLQQKLVLLLGNDIKLIVRDLRMEQKTGEAILIFYVEQVVNTRSKRLMLDLHFLRQFLLMFKKNMFLFADWSEGKSNSFRF